MSHDRGCGACGEVGVEWHCGNDACPKGKKPIPNDRQLSQSEVLPVLKPRNVSAVMPALKPSADEILSCLESVGKTTNSKQIGGDHYSSEYQHWDLMVDIRSGYLEGCATKYLSRWRRKGGEQDLLKAIHFAEKFRENHALRCISDVREIRENVERFCVINKIDGTEEIIMCLLLAPETKRDIEKAIHRLRLLMKRAKDRKTTEELGVVIPPPGYGNRSVEQEHPFGYEDEEFTE